MLVSRPLASYVLHVFVHACVASKDHVMLTHGCTAIWEQGL